MRVKLVIVNLEELVIQTKIIVVIYLVNLHGINAEPTGSAGLAGVMSAMKSGYLQPSDRVGILLTGVLR